MPTFKVWLAADTLLYLPIYALADLGILERVAKAAGIDGASISVQPSPTRGDKACIDHMIMKAEGEPPIGDIHLAVCDPIRTLQSDQEGNAVSLIGAFIKKPPFWEVGRHPANEGEIKFHKYVYYDETMATGNFLGRRVAADCEDEHRVTCKLGEEFRILRREEQPGQTRVVTADIRGMVEAMQEDPQLGIFRRFSRDSDIGDFVTTGVLTHKRYGKEYAQALSLFMEALRSSCILLRTAERPTASLIEQIMIRESLARRGEVASTVEIIASSNKAIASTAVLIAKQIFSDDIYADSLSVSHSEWAGALKPRGYDNDKRRRFSALFFKIYDPHPSKDLTAEWLMKAIKDYGRFAEDARRLRGASIASVISIAILAVHIGFADHFVNVNQSLGAVLLHWTSVGSIFLASAILTITILALAKGKISLLSPVQRLFAVDDNLATTMITGLVTLPVLGVACAVAVYGFQLQIDLASIISSAAAIVSVVIVSATKIRRRRDA
jgi:hypothetical protein